MRASILLAFVALFVAAATAARIAPDDSPFDVAIAHGRGNLREASQSFLNILRTAAVERHEGKSMEKEEGLHNRVLSIKFWVPPSESKNFEDKWMKMEHDEKEADVFTLKSAMLDNVIYHHYGEFKKHRDLHSHLTSDHFNDFAQYADDAGVYWTLELLNDMSYEVERDTAKGHRAQLSNAQLATLPADATDDQVTALYAGLTRHKTASHILISYMVPPGMGNDFVDEWTKLAEDTLDEKGNYVYSLRKSATNNVRYWAYGSWDSMRDYMDHLESKHLRSFVDFLDKHDITFFIQPLEQVE